jgi:hypothetical protein
MMHLQVAAFLCAALLCPSLVRAGAQPEARSPGAPPGQSATCDVLARRENRPWRSPWRQASPRRTFWKRLLERFSGSFAFTRPVDPEPPRPGEGENFQGEQTSYSETISATVTFRPAGAWFFRTSFYRYLEGEQAPWNPDFAYSFGYDDWRPYTLSVVYSNFGGNRLSPDRSKNERFTRVGQGSISVGWKFVLPPRVERALTVHPSGSVGLGLNYNLVPQYTDRSGGVRHFQHSFSLRCRYTIRGSWYVGASFNVYPDGDQQQPWNPDFTYGFGYSNWRPGKFSVEYSNYSGNRYPWRPRESGTGGFSDGSLSVSWTWAL